MKSKGRPYADSGNMRGYFGILNPCGDFWSHTVHESRLAAEQYVRDFWSVRPESAKDFLGKCRIIEVRVRLEPLALADESAVGKADAPKP